MAQTRSGNAALTWGLIFGFILGALNALHAVFILTGPGPEVYRLIGQTAFVVTLVAFFLAGVLAARRTGTVGAGAVAGLLTGLFAYIIGTAVGIAVAFIAPRAYVIATRVSPRNAIFAERHPHLLIAAAIVSLMFGLAWNLALGAGVGALGGLVGRSGYTPPTPPPLQGPMYQGVPGGYPPPASGAYTPAPVYPPAEAQPYGSGEPAGHLPYGTA